MENEHIPLFEAVLREAGAVNSKFRNNQYGRDALWIFLDVNEWFGIEHGGIGQDMWIASVEPMKPALRLWLRAYKRSVAEKIELLLESYAPSLPRTCRMFRQYMSENDCAAKTSVLNLLDFLLYSLKREIDEYDAEELRNLVTQASRELTVATVRRLTDFLRISSNEVWVYQFQGRRIVAPENSAYTREQFSVMAYAIFNQESWEEHQLIQKAAEKRKYADLWLYAALHFVCAMRKSDIYRLPVPSLPYPPQELRERISKGLFSRAEAKSVSEEILFRMDMNPMKPVKTMRYASPNLKLFIPESLLAPMGVILALSLSYRQPDDPFLRKRMIFAQDLREFFGDEFAEAAENKGFLSRRANKAYLQGIEASATEPEPGGASVKGYMLAAMARSHKGGVGRLPEMTDIYLKDANFAGYSPEFILREMFERGVFGFIPALLLRHYAGKGYMELNVTGQTKLIKAIGLDALQIESVTASVTKSFGKAAEIVKETLRAQCGSRGELGAILQNIAAGATPSRQSEMLCLLGAAGCACCDPKRSGCLGCGYEIYTKSALYLLMKEYARLNREKNAADNLHRERLENILERGVLPAVMEILTSVPVLYPDAEMEPLYEIMERGIQYADNPSD